jgi:hypothetical protein
MEIPYGRKDVQKFYVCKYEKKSFCSNFQIPLRISSANKIDKYKLNAKNKTLQGSRNKSASG